MNQAKSYRKRTDSVGSSFHDPSRVQIKVMHNDDLKKFSQPLENLNLDDLKYKILVGFNYVEGMVSDFSFQ